MRYKKQIILFMIISVLLSFYLLYLMSLKNSVMWTKNYGGTGTEKAWAVVEVADGGYALGGHIIPDFNEYSKRYFWLVKTDEQGNMQWNQTIGIEESIVQAMVETSDGGYALAGYTHNERGSQFLLVKTDEKGNVKWNQTYGGWGSERAHSLVQTSDGGYALAGYTYSFGAEGYDFWVVKTDEIGNIGESPFSPSS